MTSCPSTKGKSYQTLSAVASHRSGSQLQSLGVGVPVPSVHFVLLVKLTALPSEASPRKRSLARGLQERIPLDVDYPGAQGLLFSFVTENNADISKTEARFWGRAVALWLCWLPRWGPFCQNHLISVGCACETEPQMMLSDNKINVFIFDWWTKQTQNQTVFSWNAWRLLNTIQMKLKHIYLYYASYLLC